MVFLVFWDSIPKRCKGVHYVDLGESFPTHIFLQNLASIQLRTSLVKFLVWKSFSVVVRQQAERLVGARKRGSQPRLLLCQRPGRDPAARKSTRFKTDSKTFPRSENIVVDAVILRRDGRQKIFWRALPESTSATISF